MAEKPAPCSASRDGRGRPPGDVATSGGDPLGRPAFDGPALVASGRQATTGPRLLGRSADAAPRDLPHASANRNACVDLAKKAAKECPRRSRSSDHPTRIAGGGGHALSFGENDWPHPRKTGCSRWETPCPQTASAEGLVSSCSRFDGCRDRCLRHHRRVGDSRRDSLVHPDRRLCFGWNSRCLAPSSDRRHRCCQQPDGTLAAIRIAPLCPVRQRQSIHRAAPISRCHWSSHSTVPELGDHTRLCATQRNGIPGDHREFQWSVAGQGLAALRTPVPPTTAATVVRICHRTEKTPSPANGGRTPSSPLPQRLETRPASPRHRNSDLPPSDKRQRPDHRPGTSLPSRPPMDPSPHQGRSHSRSKCHPLLRPQTTPT